MSDQLNELMRGLRNQRPPSAFASGQAVRQRGRKRSQRKALVAGFAAATVVGGVGVSVAGLPAGQRYDPGPTLSSPTTAGTTTRGSLTADMLLHPSDLGSEDWRPMETELFSGVLWWWAGLCEEAAVNPPALASRVEMRYVSYGPAERTEAVSEVVELYRAGWAERSISDVRSVLPQCSVDGNQYAIVDTGFAGDEALLVEMKQRYYIGESLAPEPFVTYAAAVRVGDIVLTIIPGVRNADYTRGLSRKAVERVR